MIRRAALSISEPDVAGATWAHGIGVACLIAFVALGFGAVVISPLDETATTYR